VAQVVRVAWVAQVAPVVRAAEAAPVVRVAWVAQVAQVVRAA
jgi:hypothetical protein